ncbi:NFX1-type zinc finger-containing protein 1 [Lonchura striata]|uniref:NFX1-type zinc finger-containing protein 1 n=1 Tax=Lonchura striata TaxID=40157 RepID=A0A218UF53_9PASE|nr:NFX1-type zinc finger-containing protein 1 isoform X1 [Lonchura striata domestica]XP_021396571.1 NFX1-type zinc finger-containing protein 1 isoform X1 [Lonchura striata domestica]OWK52296.1 NFX1-type zinc finger-containing protein 1 [Lonchura striata domestica]
MEGPGQEPHARQPRGGARGHALHLDTGFIGRGRNRTNNTPGQAPKLGGNLQDSNYTPLQGQREEGFGFQKVPQSSGIKLRIQGEQANSEATGFWTKQEEGRRMRYQGGQTHERGRGPWNEQENAFRGRRCQLGQAHERTRGPWNEQENGGRGRKYQGGQVQGGARGRGLRSGWEKEGSTWRIQPRENPHFYQNATPGGAHHSEQPQQARRIGYKFLESLLKKDPSEVVITLASSSGLKELLSQTTMNHNLVQLICQVLQKVCSSQMDRQNVQHILGVVKESNFLKICLPQYVSDMVTEVVPSVRHEYPEHISNIILLLQHLISTFPASAVQKVSILLTVLTASIDSLRTFGVEITEETEKNFNKVQMLMQHLQEKRREGTLRADKCTFMQPQDGQEESYRSMSIYPTYNEIHGNEKPFLRPNFVSGKYESTSIYLDTHFRLLREDFVRPLREGIIEVLQNLQDRNLRKKKFDDIRIYFDARIIAPCCTPTGIAYKVQFDTKPLRFVHWQDSKRLLYGSLVCMSQDHFETFLFATVSNRNAADLANGIVELCFDADNQPLLGEFQPSDCFLMVETTAYFEAYRHVLEGLQKMQEEDVPFQKYIVECDAQVKEPAYLTRDTAYNLAPLVKTSGEEKCPDSLKSVCILDPNQWLSMEALKLDESQMQALNLALTKELAIIQGPPGTGKTYVGLKIVQALLTNDHVWDAYRKRPILIVCYTNHALDQFLEGIYSFALNGIVRIGGRSTSAALHRFTLKDLRKQTNRYNFPSYHFRDYEYIMREMKWAEERLREGAHRLECTTFGVMHERYLKPHMAPWHWASLTKALEDPKLYSIGSRHSLILEWLGLGVSAFNQNAAENIWAENPGGQQEGEEEREDEAEEELLAIPEMADLIEAERVIEDEKIAYPWKREKEDDSAVNKLALAMLAMKLDQEEGAAQPWQETMPWEVTRGQRRKILQKMKVELRKLNTMTEEEADAIQDVWQLDLNSRWRLYRLWLQNYQDFIKDSIREHEEQYQAAAQRLEKLKLEQDLIILSNARIVGMTTTGAAKYRKILQCIEPRVVIVEEAAEVLEAHTITTLSKECQHLILIGDHQQLQPSANVYDLAKNFNLEVSLFERLIKVDFPFVCLKYQHRMRPEIAQLISPHIYQKLENHPSVLEYENIKGVSTNVFFVEHEVPEQEIQEGKSHQNPHEAHFVVELCKYFLCQGYEPSQITILTTYTGQLFCLRKLMPAKIFQGVKVHVVDKYQGEENDIILLSLVRSNNEGRPGFLQIPNRICVALSRAKKGLYCIGNMRMLGKVPLWNKIIETLGKNGHIGQSLELCCQNHPGTKTKVSTGEDFNNVPEGGCTLPCEFRLSCGHACTRVCHPYDPEHKKYQCLKPCQKVLCADGHRCPKSCYEPCGKCMVKVEKTISKCGHIQMVPCHIPAWEIECLEPCQKKLNCGHTCKSSCGKQCKMWCSEQVTITLKCGHEQEVSCWMAGMTRMRGGVTCDVKCSVTLACGHVCSGSCGSCFGGRFHMACVRPCTRVLICSHKCHEPCTTECPPCQKECQNYCIHSKCKKKCWESCVPCAEPCEWQCQHYQCTNLCSEPCNRPRCNVPCAKMLPCGHPCVGLCGEPCPKKCLVCDHEELTQIFFGFEDDPNARFVQLEDCGHVFESLGLDHYMDEDDDVVKLKVCPLCQTPIRKNLRYGSSVKRQVEEIERVKQKIQGPAEEIESNRRRLQAALAREVFLKRNLFSKYVMLENQLKSSALSAKSIGLIENLLNFYKRVAELINSIKKIDENEQGEVIERLKEVMKWLDRQRFSFTEQELTDLQSEIQRLTYLLGLLERCKASRMMSTDIAAEINSAREILEGTKKFTEEDEAAVKAHLKKINASLPVSGLGISEAERVQIVSAIGCPRGHWFKCKNGHIYVIGECGGAMQRSTCPECHEVIGGANHTLESSNSLAPEMDGATHAAWSDVANNMLNFEDLRRLM